MTSFVALLRAVNVGGTGRLAMADLRAACGQAGFVDARTHIASGNVVFRSDLDEAGVKAALEGRLAPLTGQPVGVLVRTAHEMSAVLAANPFPDNPPNRTVALFLDQPPTAAALDDVRGRAGERLALGTREIYVAYDGTLLAKPPTPPPLGLQMPVRGLRARQEQVHWSSTSRNGRSRAGHGD
ncbi:DUF1697 domain-containing protein [Roseomonas sp. CCTCC AB2023176]|uniref:DUF1697 domain-containing protein n=1 Tax=Roseomonas sp. CCTCC AB2023176 TaxID=3342640 RepID=UPI0035D8C735